MKKPSLNAALERQYTESRAGLLKDKLDAERALAEFDRRWSKNYGAPKASKLSVPAAPGVPRAGDPVLPAGTAFLHETRSGYGYSFFNVAYVTESLHLVDMRTLGYRENEPPGMYVGKYTSGYSELQGIHPRDILEIVGVYPTYGDVPADVKRAAALASQVSLRGA